MDGLGLAHAVHRRWPPIKIIVLVALKQPDIDMPADSRFFGKPRRLNLTLSEKNGPPVHPPEKRSFGTRPIETLGCNSRAASN
jgi:hypothetical protein